MAIHESRALLPTITVWAFATGVATMPADDFYCAVKGPYGAFSHESVTRSRSPEVSSTAFRTQPSDLQPVPLMDMGFAVTSPPSGCEGDFHPQAVEHARHTTRRAGTGPALLTQSRRWNSKRPAR